MPNQGVLPPIVVLPLAILTVLLIAAHLAALQADRAVPLSRRRIRTANGVVMLLTTLTLAYAFAYASTADPARFALTWGAAIMLLTVVLALSSIDVLNNLRLTRLQRRRVKKAAIDLHSQLATILKGHGHTGPRLARSPADDESTDDNTDDRTGNDQPDAPDSTGRA